VLRYWQVILFALFAFLGSAGLAPSDSALRCCLADETAAPDPLNDIFSGGAPGSSSDLMAMQDHLQMLSDKVIPTTVAVQVGAAQGSGVIVSPDGYILTAAHVVGEPGRRAMVILHDGRRVPGKTLGVFRTIDAGLVKIQAAPSDLGRQDWPHAEMGESKELQPGQWCLATGHPGGFQSARTPVVRLGRILSIKPDAAITTDCTLVGGDSGGPLFDMKGNVIGVHSRIGGPLTLNLHVPVGAYRESWDRLVAAEEWGFLPGNEPFIGVVGENDSLVAKISRVYPGAPADKAGVQPGDVITKIGDQPITTFESLKAFVESQKPGARVNLEVLRADGVVKLDLTIGRRRQTN